MGSSCATKYPLVLVHGVGSRDWKHLRYWGRIPARLEAEGARIFYGNQDSYATVEKNAAALRETVRAVLQSTGAPKVNIIAHSKGGLDARFMISRLGMGDKVASLTTVCTPHHGSKTVDKLLAFPSILVHTVAFFCNIWSRLIGDKQPDAYRVFQQFTTAFAARFNEETPDVSEVYGQSYAFLMKRARSDFMLWLPYLVVRAIEGENDGLVTPASAQWALFRGAYRGAGNRGISHCDAVDFRRHPLTRSKQNEGIRDITDFYLEIVRELMKRGY